MSNVRRGKEPGRRRVYTPREYMGLTGLSKTSVYNGLASGEIPSFRIGRRILIPRVAADQMLAGFAASNEECAS